MKMKYFFTALVAALSTVFVSCSDDNTITTMPEFQLSTSYVSLPMAGGSVTVDVVATASWEVVSAPSWLGIGKMSGDPGEAQITFVAQETLDGRTGEVLIDVSGKTQRINVIQGLATISEATVAEVMAGPDSKTYQVKGVVTKITETVKYGNFYMNDGTSATDLYIYGTKYNGQTQQAALEKLGVEVGDEIIVSGPKTTYNGTVELVDVDVIKLNKSLIKVDSISVENLPSDGGDFSVFLVNKGNGLYVDVPAEAQSWLSIKAIKGNEVIFHASANTAGPRAANLVFKTVSAGKEYTAQAEISQDGLSGTADVPFTVEEAIAFCSKLSGQTTQSYYVKGIVSKIASEFGTKYGNGSFWISSDGNYNDDLSKDFEAYQVYWFNGENWVEGNGQVSVGDEVIICSPLTLYKGATAETVGKAGHIVSINGISENGYGLGSKAMPFTPEGACKAAFAGCTSYVYVAGKVAKFPKDSDRFNSQYGNATFWMSEDGSYTGNKSVEFEAYRVLYLGNRKWTDGDDAIFEGNSVVIYGPLTTYNGTAETQANKGYLISVN